MKKANITGLIVFIVIIVVSVAAAVVSFVRPKPEVKPMVTKSQPFHFSFGSGKPFAKKVFPQGNYVAKLYITGVITDETRTYNQEWILDTISDLAEDKNNVGIMLYMDTPGGGVYQSDEVYLALLDYKKTTERPVYAYITQMSASGGYYIACAADKIFGNRNGLTGSIGVIFGSSVDATELLAKIGVKTKTFHAGKNKTMLNIDEPLTEEQEAIMQSIADEAYNQFTAIVATSRNMDIEKVRELADGRIYTTAQAERNGLIDGVYTFDEAIDNMFEDEELGDSDVEPFEYEYKETFSSFFGSMLSRAIGTNALSKQLESAQLSYPAYYFAW